MLNLIINILFGYGLETLYFGYAFNKIKGVSYKSTYFIFLISYIISAIIINFSFNNIYYFYIMLAFIFEIIYFMFHKIKFNITNVFLMLNIILVSSLLLAFLMLFTGYNTLYLVLNIICTIILLILVKVLPLNKYYKVIVENWNRTTHNKIKSVTIRNLTMIFIYTFVTLINVFVNEVFINIFQKLL